MRHNPMTSDLRWRMGRCNDSPLRRAMPSSSVPAPRRPTVRNVHTETSLTAIGNSTQLVPQTTVRSTTHGSTLARERGKDCEWSLKEEMGAVKDFQA